MFRNLQDGYGYGYGYGLASVDLDALSATYLNWRQGHGKALCVLRSVSALVSCLASITLIWMILRSNASLSTTNHRLVFALCISDILYSLSVSFFNTMAPSDDMYYVWNARGNMATCDAQGFVLSLGVVSGVFYNCSLNLYYLAVVKYEKSDEYIRTRIEPFLIIVPIILALVGGIVLLVRQNFNDDGYGNCFYPAYDPPHCVGYEDGEIPDGFEIPCGRGREGAFFAFFASFALVCFPPIIIGVSLGAIYRATKRQEQKLSRYGVGSLRASVLQRSALVDEDDDGDSSSSDDDNNTDARIWETARRFKRSMKSMASSLRTSVSMPSSRSNQQWARTRTVMNRAFAYSMAYFLTWAFHIILVAIRASGKDAPIAIVYLTVILGPLQGLWNFLVYLHPKVLHAKGSKNNISWWQAFKMAFWSTSGGGSNGKRGKAKTNLRPLGHRKRRDNTINFNRREEERILSEDIQKQRVRAPRSVTFSGISSSTLSHSARKSTGSLPARFALNSSIGSISIQNGEDEENNVSEYNLEPENIQEEDDEQDGDEQKRNSVLFE